MTATQQKQVGPIKYLFKYLGKSIAGIGSLLKHPKMLLPMIFMSIFWVALSYIKLAMPDDFFVEVASFLTFAQGGMYGGLIGAVGGVFGKAILAGVVTCAFVPLLTGQKREKPQREKRTQAFFMSGFRGLALMVFGFGLALIVYHFLTGNASFENSIIGLTLIISCYKGLGLPEGFAIGLIKSFSKGRTTTRKAGNMLVGMIWGFMGGIVMSFNGLGELCYLGGAVVGSAGLLLILLSKSKKNSAIATVLLILFTMCIPLIRVNAAENWQDPFEAYDITEEGPMRYLELSRAMEANPPSSMKMTIVAAGLKFFEYSVPLSSPISVEIINGESDTINVSSGNMPIGMFDSSFNIYLEENKWIVDGSVSYSMNDTYTNNQSDEGSAQIIDNGYYDFAAIIGAPSYLYEPYIEDGYLYFNINLDYAYGQFMEDSQVLSAAQLIARIDSVSLEPSPETSEKTVTGAWQMIDESSYVIQRYNSESNEKIDFTDIWGFSDDQNVNQVEADGNSLSYKYIENGNLIADYQTDFSRLPGILKANEILQIDAFVVANLNGSTLDQNNPQESITAIQFLPGERESIFATVDPANENQTNFMGVNLGEIYFEKNATGYSGSVPEGTTQGQRLTVERIMGTYTGVSVLATLYEWDINVVVPTENGDSGLVDATTNEDESPLDEYDEPTDDDWTNDGSKDWDEHASEEDTGYINIASVLGALIGAGAAVAGGFGGFRGPESYGNYDPQDGTLVVTSPNGSQEIYTKNPETGEFEDSYGNTLETGEIERAHAEQKEAQEWTKKQRDLMEKGKDGDSEYWHKVNRVQHLKEKFEKEAGHNSDALTARMAEKLEDIQKDINSGKGFDEKAYKAIQKTYGKYTLGQIANNNDFPSDYTTMEQIKDATNLSMDEIARGESGKAIALRIAVGIATQGKSEFVFEPAKAMTTVKDYVDAGGDSWREAVSKAAYNTVVDEGIGRGIGAGIGLGAKVIGKGGSIVVKLAEKTKIGKSVSNMTKEAAEWTGKKLGTDVKELAKKALGIGSKNADDAVKALKSANAAKAIKSANQAYEDLIKKAGTASDDLAKRIGQQADDAAKTIGKQTDDAAKTVSKQTDDVSRSVTKEADELKKPTNKADEFEKNAEKQAEKAKAETPYEKAEEKWDNQSKNADKEAEKEIAKYKEKTKNQPPSKRDQLYKEGQDLGKTKVEGLEKAQENLKLNPDSREAKKAYDEALRKVQQDKYAMNHLKEIKGDAADELRGNFNKRNDQFNQAAIKNTNERIAAERGIDPKHVKSVEASNKGSVAREADSSRTARQVDIADQTDPNYKGQASVDDMKPRTTEVDGAPMDKDVTSRVFDEKTNEWIDVPKEDVERIYQQELYKVHHNGELPKVKVNGRDSLDEDALKEFAEKMDHTVTDRLGKDAYGTGDKDLINIIKRNSEDIKRFEDVSSVTGTMEYKSNEWFERADQARKLADDHTGQVSEELLRQAEALEGEGIRQLTKQFKNQTGDQIKAAIASGKQAKVPDDLFKAMKILDRVGKSDGLSVSEAEAILKGMGTSIDKVVWQNSALMEIITKFK